VTPRELVFWADAIVAVLTAGMVLLHRNAVICALSLVMHLCSMAVFFVLLDATFLGVVQVIVYAGAIMVLFLFVIMLLDPKGEAVAGRVGRIGSIQLIMTLGAALLLVAGILRILPALARSGPAEMTGAVPEGFGAIRSVGEALFSTYLFPFEIASVLLLVAMMGALFMGKKEILE
jgi:NADH-quinone oxidoreductase subunit J